MESRNEAASDRLQALNNSVAFCDFKKSLPEFVFRGDWERFLFFQSDYVFASEFNDFVHRLLRIEGGHAACLINLDKTEADHTHYQVEPLFIDERTDGATYMRALHGEGPAHGWLYAMNRFVCTSDIGRWCVYCERAMMLQLSDCTVSMVTMRSALRLIRFTRNRSRR
jgi:hypothetical protein